MPLTRAQKNEIIEEYVALLQQSQALILADYRGLTVKELQQLRRQVREAGGQARVVKNTLFRIALERSNLPVPTDLLVGPVLVGFAVEDIPPLAKAFVDFAKEAGKFKIKGGLLEGREITPEDVDAIAKLPPLEVIRAQLVAAIEAPMSQLVSVISAPMREIAAVLQARSEQSEAA